MKARYQYRFYPTNQQRQSLAQLFGCVRVVWNDALAFCKESEKLPGYNRLARMLTQAKKTESRQWLGDVSSVPLQQSLRQLATAYKNFFESRKGKRKGKKVGSPKFKKKSNRQSATFASNAFNINEGEVALAKIGKLKPIWSRKLPSVPSSVTVIKDCANRYFLSFVVEVEPEEIDTKNQGWKEFRVLVEAKSQKYERNFVVINRWEPTSQICSDCGFKWGKIELSVRSVLCLNCGTEHDRDSNASKNIEMVGIGHCHDLKCTSRQSKTTSVASVNEA